MIETIAIVVVRLILGLILGYVLWGWGYKVGRRHERERRGG